MRGMSAPHTGQGQFSGAVPTGRVSSTRPSCLHRYSNLAICDTPSYMTVPSPLSVGAGSRTVNPPFAPAGLPCRGRPSPRCRVPELGLWLE